MKELELQNVYNKCLLDNEDYCFFKSMNCYESNGYVLYSVGKTNIPIHRAIVAVSDETLVVDHIDGNPFNNQKSNLRICSRAENSKNCKISKRNSSGYKGVSLIKKSQKWKARIMVSGKSIDLGLFLSQEEAALAYDIASKKFHGRFGVTNLELAQREAVKILRKPTKFDDLSLMPGMIPLGNKKYAVVDLEDFEEVSKRSWSLSKGGYAFATMNGTTMYLHRFVMDASKGKTIDHIDRDKLNNTKKNLKECSLLENLKNRVF